MALFRRKKKRAVIDSINTANVKIKIFADYGGSVPVLKDQFLAKEQRDGFGGIVIVNKDKDFTEDANFDAEEAFDRIKTMLALDATTPEEKLIILNKKIGKQELKIFYLENHVELNAVFNYCDEFLYLRDLKIYRDHIKQHKDEKGTFFRIEENGIRTYEFVRRDGFFYPIFFGTSTYSAHPHYVTKHKIKMREDEIFNAQWGSWFKRNIRETSMVMMFIILGLLIFGAMFGGWKVMEKSQQIDQIAFRGARECSDLVIDYNKKITEALANECVLKKLNNTETDVPRINNTIRILNATSYKNTP